VTLGTLLGLLAALTYGAGDFSAGLAGRRAPSAAVAGTVLGLGLTAALLAALVAPGVGPSTRVIAWGALSGLGGGVGTLALYHGLATGRMSVVATLSAVMAAVLPAIVGVVLGNRLSIPAVIGILLALPAIGLVSRPPHESDAAPAQSGAAVGLLAGLGFALLFIALDQAGTRSGVWPIVPGQAVALAVIIPFAARSLRGGRGWPRGRALWLSLSAGLLSVTANFLYLDATGHGQLAVVAVLTSLYPAVTVILARVLLGERWGRAQALGLGVAVIAVVLVSLR
jgi:drug/metabolite transporter (DMT)-like permease